MSYQTDGPDRETLMVHEFTGADLMYVGKYKDVIRTQRDYSVQKMHDDESG